MMRVLACVVNWNTAGELPGVLASLRLQQHLAQIVVIDNASYDGSAEIVRGQAGVQLVANDSNLGFAGAANQAVALALELGADALLLCNPDVRLSADYLTYAVAALAADPQRASVAGRLWRSHGGEPDPDAPRIIDSTGHVAYRTRLFRNRGEGQTDDGRFDQSGEIFGVSGAAALYRIAALQDVAIDGEIFDEDLFAYFEDVDMDWRLQRRGWQSWYEANATGWHERGGAGPRRSAFVEELNFANRLLVLAKNDRPAWADWPGIVLTTLLKALELAITVPSAVTPSIRRLRQHWSRMQGKARAVDSRSTVARAEVERRWFAAFDYVAWVKTWWRRVSREASAD